jgi:hypothetical protein
MLQFHHGETSVMNMPVHIYQNFMKTKHNSLSKLEGTQNNITQHTVIPAAVVIRFVVFIETNQTLSVIFYHKTSIYMQW